MTKMFSDMLNSFMDNSFQEWLWLNEVKVIFEHSNVKGMTWKQFEPYAVKALETGRWDEGKIRDFVGGDSLLARLMRAGVQATTLLGIMHHDPSLAPILHAPMAMIQNVAGHDDAIGGHDDGGFASKVAGHFPSPAVGHEHGRHDDHDHDPTNHDMPHQEHPAPGSKEEGESEGPHGRSKLPVAGGPPGPDPEGGFGTKVRGHFPQPGAVSPGHSMWTPTLDRVRQSRDDAAAKLAMDVEAGGRRGRRPPPPPPPNPWWKKDDEDDKEDEVSDW